LPRRSPFTQADIEARSRLSGLGPSANPRTGTPVHADWNFSEAMDTLNIRHFEERTRCADQLSFICTVNRLARCAEAQETRGRKARAFQLAPRWQKARMREWREMDTAKNANEKLTERAFRRWQKLPSLPQSLEQEAVRELGHIPSSRTDFALLKERQMRMASRGRYKSWALRNTVHALQTCAGTWNKKFIWSAGRAPPKRLVKFLVQVLRAAGIKHPNPDTNWSKFIVLVLRPRKQDSARASGSEKQTEKPPEPAEASGAEKQAEKPPEPAGASGAEKQAEKPPEPSEVERSTAGASGAEKQAEKPPEPSEVERSTAGASGAEKQAEKPPEPSEVERRLAKVYL
jgi:hypothetical protein